MYGPVINTAADTLATIVVAIGQLQAEPDGAESGRIACRQDLVVHVAISIEILGVTWIDYEWISTRKPPQHRILHAPIHVNEIQIVEHRALGNPRRGTAPARHVPVV